ncbi:CPBP family intramembrane metalloprotease [Salegentibacter mishustinae]|uniref:CPBP family intramembrane glutamic endopeptidase n=1 Tax=Salegentibacter mishustinae TaxID=270918 RepID=UPI001CE17A33|nr:CPBP family intramembrane glutamic endopeptidase [Salegentibacter mishustinae]UBZ08765.1 CPBP family intramembrane metalloprotease [Salegentibacter mishustinae]
MSLLTPLLWLLIISPLFIIAHFSSKKTNFKYLVIFAIYFLADSYLQALGSEYLTLDFLNLDWNWSGKILSLILSLSFILYHSKEIRREIGFTSIFILKTLKFGVIIFLGFLLFDLIFKMMLFPKGSKFDLETFAFQALMPGTEELIFRGIYLWLLSKAFISTKNFGWGFIIVTILFGLIHGVFLTEAMEIKFDLITIFYLTLISSLSLGILRKFSGNLILPILGHNAINLMNAIIRIL